MSTPFEFPAYNIYFLQNAKWRLHPGSPIMQMKQDVVKELSKTILNSSPEILAVKIFGVFNRHQHPIFEVSKGSIEDLELRQRVIAREIEHLKKFIEEPKAE